MAMRRPEQTVVLGLVLRLLLGLGLGLEAAPTRFPAQTLGPSPGSCLPTHFQCRITGYCMPLAWHCDGDWDCPDGSDEEECNEKPCSQDKQCPPPMDSPCSCDSIDGCKNLPNCSSQPCQAGELRCPLDGTCIPPTWLCDGHPDCVDSSDELGCGTETLQESMSVGTPVTPESVTYLRNTTFGRVQDSVQSRSRSAYGVLTAAVVLSAGLVAATLFVLSQLCAKGLLSPLKLLLERTASSS
ncbi:CD320 molecule [Phyllostomus discolor]|uniref:CD320 antigen n=2 Tax=Phyllostomus discolor TaxID=89673 RepID=A0A6J2MCV1_9CHIR|nr:CD320 antigen [Phyllostomus discolor]XP_035888623.1 CD320 antigen [Phyllostomus discolor]KAF6092825.1 CD320 molecule [Phyllostomus discolor]